MGELEGKLGENMEELEGKLGENMEELEGKLEKTRGGPGTLLIIVLGQCINLLVFCFRLYSISGWIISYKNMPRISGLVNISFM